ncbi:MAG: molybdate ABC transporter permease subunit [Pseudomonadota bacterium]
MSEAEWTVIVLSLKVAVWATLVALPFGILAAYALARWRFPGRSALNVVVHLPLILPPVVTGYLLLILFGRNGMLGGYLAELGIVFAFDWTGAALTAGIMGFPLMVRAIRLSIEAVDPGLEGAAASLGAGRFARVVLVTLPLALPGILMGAILAFAKALGEFGATITFVSNIPGETQTLPLAIYTALQIPGGEGAAIRLVLLSLGVSVGALAISEFAGQRAARWVAGR